MTDRRKPWWALFACSAIAILGTFSVVTRSYASATQDALVLVGPVEAVDNKKQTATILGQKVALGKLPKPAIGTSVAIFGQVQSTGVITASSIQSAGIYVPGANVILLTGLIKTVDASVGRLAVGSIFVDYSAATTVGVEGFAIGSVVQLIGTQPAPAGVVLAEQLSVATKDGIIGGGLKLDGIIGGGLKANGIIGGGIISLDGIIGGGKISADGITGGGTSAADGIIGGGKVSAEGIIGGGI